MRIVSPFPSNIEAIKVSSKGVSTAVVNGESYARVAYEDPHVQDVTVGYINVVPTELEDGVYQAAPNSSETTLGGTTLISLVKQADFPHNRFDTTGPA